MLGTEAFPATSAALAWMGSQGELVKVAVEGTGSYGAGLARYLAARGVEVAEVIRPNRQVRRQRGKSDAADAVAAALAALNGEVAGVPKSPRRGGRVDPGAAGGPGRRGQGPHPGRQPAARPDRHRARAGAAAAGWTATRAAGGRGGPVPPAEPDRPRRGRQGRDGFSVACRHQALTAEIARLDAALEELVTHAAPAEFLAKPGVASGVAAPLLATTGDNPGRVPRRPASPRCAAPARWTPPPASRSATGSTVAAAGRPTPRRGRSP